MPDISTGTSNQVESEEVYDAQTLFGPNVELTEDRTDIKLKHTYPDGSRVL